VAKGSPDFFKAIGNKKRHHSLVTIWVVIHATQHTGVPDPHDRIYIDIIN
jgi:hypothetical protein